MWLVLRVNDLVTTEGGGLTEAFAADLADKRPRPSVDGHVPSEIVVRIEDLATFRAGECLWLHRSSTRRGRRGRSYCRQASRRLNVTARRNRFLVSGTLVNCFPRQFSARGRRDFLMSGTTDTLD